MKHVEKSKLNAPQAPIFKRSLLAMCILAATSQGQAFAAEPASAAEPEEVVVTGIRASLQKAQDIKKEAATVKDVVTASDISALPDKSVVEALSRVPGVAIERFAGPGDSDHFGAEGSSATIRGLNRTRSEFNGRDSFSASGGGGLNFGDVPPELMGSVEVVKNLTADLIEGGISGSVNLNTRKPFDHQGMQAAGTVKAAYGDMSGEISPSLSGLFSNTWDTDVGEFGALFNLSASQFLQRSSGVGVHNFYERGQGADKTWYNANIASVPGKAAILNKDGTIKTPATPAIIRNDYRGKGYPVKPFTTVDALPDEEYGGYPVGPYLPNQKSADLQTLYMPPSVTFRNQDSDRQRTGFANSYQWKSPDEKLLATLEFIRSDSKLAWTERAIENKNSTGAQFKDNRGVYTLLQSPDFFTAGQLKDARALLAGAELADADAPTKETAADLALAQAGVKKIEDGNARYAKSPLRGVSSIYDSFDSRGRFDHGIISNVGYIALTRNREERSIVNDLSFNLQYKPTDQLTLWGDVQRIEASNKVYDFVIHNQMDLDMYTDLRGKTPFIDVLGKASVIDGDGIFRNSTVTDAKNVVVRSAMDHAGDSVGDSWSLKGDGEYTFEDVAWIKSVKTGVRYSEKNQTHQDGDYNWGVVSPEWNGATDADGNPDPYAKITGANHPEFSEVYDFGTKFHGGGVLSGQTSFLFPKESLAKDRNAFWNLLNGDLDPSRTGVQGYYNNIQYYKQYNEDGSLVLVSAKDADGKVINDPVTKLPVPALDKDGNTIPDLRQENLVAAGSEDPVWVLPQFRGNYAAKNITDVIPGTDYRKSDTNELSQTRTAVYGRLDFGNDELPVKLKGNVGARYVAIDLESKGYTAFPKVPGDGFFAKERQAELFKYTNGVTWDPEKEKFANGATDKAMYNVPTYTSLLPSFNMTFGFTDDFLIRFAVSKAIYLPTLDNLKASVDVDGTYGQSDLEWKTKPDGKPTGEPDLFSVSKDNPNPPNLHEKTPLLDIKNVVDPEITGFTVDADSNPYLLPEEAINTDLTAEWYFSSVGSLTLSLFNKDLTNLIERSTRDVVLLNPSNGVALPVTYTGPDNVGNALIRGFEVAYQQTYEFLPEPFSGLGIQANFTVVEAAQTTDYTPRPGRYRDFKNMALAGLSENTANFTVFYENDKISTRFAYNWRSEYLLTRRDEITKSPVYVPNTGLLDYSFRYTINDSYKVGFEVNNVLNEQSETRVQYDEAGNTDPRNFFVNDRAFALTFSAAYN